MANENLRRAIAHEAARLIHDGVETDFQAARKKAARRIGRGFVPDADFPSKAEVRQLLQEFAHIHAAPPGEAADRWAVFRLLLEPLAGVAQKAEFHPEGDVLYHSLQVYELARAARPYDAEFQLAALLHDVGKGIEPRRHRAAAVRALRDWVDERVIKLIENLELVRSYRDGTMPEPQRRKWRGDDDLDDLLELDELDRAGRVPGAAVGSLESALGELRELEGES